MALLALAGVSWAVTDSRMSGMDAGPGTDPGTPGFYITAWVVMMAAMMFPSIAPMVLAYARITPRLNAGRAHHGTTSLFVGGYLVSWTCFGLVAYGLFVAARSLFGYQLAWHRAGPYVAGGVIVLAAVYQLTPTKDACLRRCRAPFAFLTDEWRAGRLGAVAMGARHGAWCVGCCWGLMAALFAVGLMSLGWMAFVSALIAIEKLVSWRSHASRAIAVALLALGLGVAFAPDRVPELTLPNSPQAASAMQSMRPAPRPATSMKRTMRSPHDK
jgi:predicted metal-binding membrane protein